MVQPETPEAGAWTLADHGVLAVYDADTLIAGEQVPIGPDGAIVKSDGTVLLSTGRQVVHMTAEGYAHWRAVAAKLQRAFDARARTAAAIAETSRALQARQRLQRRLGEARNRAERRAQAFGHERFARARGARRRGMGR